MSDQDNDQNLDDLMQEAQQRLNVDIDHLRQISPEEIQYLLDQCPYLQIVDSQFDLTRETEFQIIRANTNWDIHSYGDAMSSSPGRFIFGGGNYTWDEDEGGSGGVVNPGQGTVVSQAYRTALEMVDLAVSQKWAGIKIVDGHRIMKRAAWIRASQRRLKVYGYMPEQADHEIAKRALLSDMEFETLRRDLRR